MSVTPQFFKKEKKASRVSIKYKLNNTEHNFYEKFKTIKPFWKNKLENELWQCEIEVWLGNSFQCENISKWVFCLGWKLMF